MDALRSGFQKMLYGWSSGSQAADRPSEHTLSQQINAHWKQITSQYSNCHKPILFGGIALAIGSGIGANALVGTAIFITAIVLALLFGSSRTIPNQNRPLPSSQIGPSHIQDNPQPIAQVSNAPRIQGNPSQNNGLQPAENGLTATRTAFCEELRAKAKKDFEDGTYSENLFMHVKSLIYAYERSRPIVIRVHMDRNERVTLYWYAVANFPLEDLEFEGGHPLRG